MRRLIVMAMLILATGMTSAQAQSFNAENPCGKLSACRNWVERSCWRVWGEVAAGPVHLEQEAEGETVLCRGACDGGHSAAVLCRENDWPRDCGNGTCQSAMGEDCYTCTPDCGECPKCRICLPGEDPAHDDCCLP